jgi:hypothetical protein
MLASMSQAEKLILGGALLLVLVDLVFSIIAQQYGFSTIIWTAAVAALVIAFVRRRSPELLPARYEVLLLGAAAIVVVVGLRQVLGDLFVFLRPPLGGSPAFMLGFVGLIAGVAAMAYGAWLIWKDAGAR